MSLVAWLAWHATSEGLIAVQQGGPKCLTVVGGLGSRIWDSEGFEGVRVGGLGFLV